MFWLTSNSKAALRSACNFRLKQGPHRVMETTLFRRLRVGGWRQFDSIDIQLHPRLTVITGANGAGKSTLLSLLTMQFGWQRPFLSVPRRNAGGEYTFENDVLQDAISRLEFRNLIPEGVGTIEYVNGAIASIAAQSTGSQTLNVYNSSPQNVAGTYIDSHRPTQTYTQVGSIPLQPMTAEQSYSNYNQEMLRRYAGNSHSNFAPIYRMKESLISMAIFGEGNKRLGGSNQAILDTFAGFNGILKALLPESLGFKEIAIRSPDVVLVTETGEFMIDASSGGIMTLIDTAWRIYMFSRGKESFVVVMDEPENHLHPTMQRTLMTRLVAAFPGGQFIIATHSPFMVSSVRDSNVYVLRYRQDERERSLAAEIGFSAGRRVFSQPISNSSMSAGASDVLREVLGVPATMPEWVEKEIGEVVERYRGTEFSSELMTSLRADLNNLGFGQYFSDAVGRLTGVE